VAHECRHAALAFVNGAASGWDKVDLASWLTGEYAWATRHVPRGERVAALARSEVEEPTLERVVSSARLQVVASLEDAVLNGGTLAFAAEASRRGLVREALDPNGEPSWVPVDGARMRLRDRVLALFAADFLHAPEAYGALYVCHRCELVAFDPAARELGTCRAHRRVSGFVTKAVDSDEDLAMVASP